LSVVEILCIGNELLSGITLNTNAHWIGKKIIKLGAKVRRVTVVADDLEEINIALKDSLGRKPDWIVTCGGLGPTYDDMTMQAIAQSLERKLVLDPIALQMVKDSYKRLGQNVRLNAARLKMAMIPNDSIPIHNPIGNAPAVHIYTQKTQIVCLPGVPSEMKAIFTHSILDDIKAEIGQFTVEEHYYHVEGVSEATLARTLIKLVKSFPRHALYLKTHPQGYKNNNIPVMKVQIVSKGKKKAYVQEILEKVSNVILSEVKKYGGKIRLE
jgi:nicotinamide-nucleotide amidase